MKIRRAACLTSMLAFALPAFAIWVPQTRAEFVAAVERGEGATKRESFLVDRGLDEIYRDLEARATGCLDKEMRRSGFVGGEMEVSSSDYNPTLARINPGSAAFTLQVVHRPRGLGATPPPGGLYVLAADLHAISPRRTEVVLYRPTIGFKKITRSLKQWTSGESDECPKLN